MVPTCPFNTVCFLDPDLITSGGIGNISMIKAHQASMKQEKMEKRKGVCNRILSRNVRVAACGAGDISCYTE